MAYECEWINELPELPNDMGSDFDRATYAHRDFDTLEKARKWARAIAPGLPIEVVLIRDFWLEPAYPGARIMVKEYGRFSEEYST